MSDDADDYVSLRQRHLEFTSNVLRSKLRDYQLHFTDIQEEVQEYHKLSNHINNLSVLPSDVPYSLLVDVGQDCLVQAQLDTPREVYVHIGMGFHVALPHQEAKKVIATRIALLDCKASHVEANITAVSEHIVEVNETLNHEFKLLNST